jgi:hypothetical protein
VHAYARKTKQESGTMAVEKFQTSLPGLGFKLPNFFAKKSTAEVHNETLDCVI